MLLKETECEELSCTNSTSLSVLILDIEILNPGFRNSTPVTTTVEIDLPAVVNYTFNIQKVKQSVIYLDSDKSTHSADPSVSLYSVSPNSYQVLLTTDTISARSIAHYTLSLEREKIPSASDFLPILIQYRVSTTSNSTSSWFSSETYRELNYTLYESVPSKSKDSTERQYTAVVIGLSVAGGVFLLVIVIVTGVLFVRWVILRNKRQSPSPIPRFSEVQKSVEPGTIDLELEQTPNQI